MQKISPLQLYMLFSQFLYSTTIGFYIRPLAQHAGFSAWISVALGLVLGLLLVYWSYRLAIRRPSQAFGQYGQSIVGKWIHYPLSIVMIFSFLLASAFVLRELEDLVAEFYLRDTPNWAIAALFGLCIFRAVRSGLGTIFIGAQGIFFISIITIVSVPLLVSHKLNMQMAVALWTNFDPPGIWNGALLMTALFGEMAIILFFFPSFAQADKTMKALGWAAVTSAIITLTVLLAIILLFGPDLTANLSVPTLEMIRYIKYGSFFENLDPLLIVFWLYSMFIKCSLFMYAAVIGLTHIFGLKDHKPLSSFMTAAMIIVSLVMVRTGMEVEHFLQHGEVAFLLFTELIPAVYLAVDSIRSARRA
ncbi:GerAB/ArcD/ProY family transporter [Paenibacillus contaminans]|uniref:Spore gernimation protein n=1 Tax=Paenibacillus contaminans TaxID=450362 RepID=A0A329MNK3_9BACL|nr:endospore germination permease [Paenibacillus contaminans]RAV20876.1 spore gernimation protein [Paenibacillus contaminans]